MAIDTSIYGLLKPVQAPSYMDSMKSASVISGAAMQQAKGAQEMDAAKMQAHLQKASAFGNALEGLAGLSEQERAAAYPKVHAELAQAGIISPDQAPAEYDPTFYKSHLARYRQSSPAIKAQLEKAQLGLIQSQTAENYAQAKSAGAKADGLNPELQTNYGVARTADDAKQLKSAGELKSSFDRKLNEMIALRNDYGGEALNREAVGRGKQLSNDLLLLYKDMSKLGVLSKSDEAILNSIIPSDPLEFNISGLVGQDPTMHRLTKFKEDVDADFRGKLANRIRPGTERGEPQEQYAGQPPRGGSPLPGTEANAAPRSAPPAGMIRMQAPDGSVRLIPKSQKGEAIAAGGKVIP